MAGIKELPFGFQLTVIEEAMTADVVKLRKATGAGMMDCKNAMTDAEGNFDRAVEIIREKGKLIASKRADRESSEGVVLAKASEDKSFGAILSLNCETDFVAKNDEFVKLARDIAMHATATNPQFLRSEDVSPGLEVVALLDQPFIKNPEVTVKNLIEQAIQKFGEKIEIGKFVRYSISE